MTQRFSYHDYVIDKPQEQRNSWPCKVSPEQDCSEETREESPKKKKTGLRKFVSLFKLKKPCKQPVNRLKKSKSSSHLSPTSKNPSNTPPINKHDSFLLSLEKAIHEQTHLLSEDLTYKEFATLTGLSTIHQDELTPKADVSILGPAFFNPPQNSTYIATSLSENRLVSSSPAPETARKSLNITPSADGFFNSLESIPPVTDTAEECDTSLVKKSRFTVVKKPTTEADNNKRVFTLERSNKVTDHSTFINSLSFNARSPIPHLFVTDGDGIRDNVTFPPRGHIIPPLFPSPPDFVRGGSNISDQKSKKRLIQDQKRPSSLFLLFGSLKKKSSFTNKPFSTNSLSSVEVSSKTPLSFPNTPETTPTVSTATSLNRSLDRSNSLKSVATITSKSGRTFLVEEKVKRSSVEETAPTTTCPQALDLLDLGQKVGRFRVTTTRGK